MKRLLAVCAFAALAPLGAAHAQLGAAVHFRSVNGADTDAADPGSERRGFTARAFYDWSRGPAWGWRAEAGFAQTKYERTTLFVSENTLEAAAMVQRRAAYGAFTGGYLFAGPVGSFRLNCGVSGGFVDCGNTPKQQLGYTLGAGYRSPITERRDLVFEVRFADRVVGAGGASFVSLGFGLQAR